MEERDGEGEMKERERWRREGDGGVCECIKRAVSWCTYLVPIN